MGVLHPRGPRQTTRLRQIVIVAVTCLAVYCIFFTPSQNYNNDNDNIGNILRPGPGHGKNPSGHGYGHGHRGGPLLSPELLNNKFLTEKQCRVNFPGLLDQVDAEVAKGPFRLKPPTSHLGPLIARIRDGQLYILSAARKVDLSKDMLAHRSATLHQIANALLTWPAPPPSSSSSSSSRPFSHIPNTIFAFNHHDDPQPGTFSYSRPADTALYGPSSSSSNNENDHDEKTGEKLSSHEGRWFPIPHFSFYSWPLPFIGSFPRAAGAITAVEASLPNWSDKIPRAVWRGTTWFNNPRAGRLRQNLVRAFGTGEVSSSSSSSQNTETEIQKRQRNREWADIEALDWVEGKSVSTTTNTKPGGGGGNGEHNASNALQISDFCRYRYIIHTEGVTYSGRFQFHNLCDSVVLTPPVAWMQHVTHLLRPVFSYELDPSSPDVSSSSSSSSSTSKKSHFSSLFSRSPDPKTTTQENPSQGLPRHPIDLGPKEKPSALSPYPAPWVHTAWPDSHSDEANIVFVAPDWSDLEATVRWLEARPGIARGIAKRQRALFHDGGYLSPAAEMCYWRGLISGWASIARFRGKDFEDLEYGGDGMTWEEFSIKELHK